MYRMVYRHRTQLNTILRMPTTLLVPAAQCAAVRRAVGGLSWLDACCVCVSHQLEHISIHSQQYYYTKIAAQAHHSSVKGRMTGAMAAKASAMTQICMRLPAQRRPRLASMHSYRRRQLKDFQM